MKTKPLYILVSVTVLGIVAAVFLQQDKYSKCSRACVREGFGKGECVSWVSRMSAESWCKERGATFVSAHCPSFDVQRADDARGGGGVICCCE